MGFAKQMMIEAENRSELEGMAELCVETQASMTVGPPKWRRNLDSLRPWLRGYERAAI